MSGAERRKQILIELKGSDLPISAANLANKFGVSRQVIVGDIALLRANGDEILSTPRGYSSFMPATGQYIGVVVCSHTRTETARELTSIVALGGTVVDVKISHPHYGELSGSLNIHTKKDVNMFIYEFETNKQKLLSELTGGLHSHTISCSSKSVFLAIEAELNRLGFLYKG